MLMMCYDMSLATHIDIAFISLVRSIEALSPHARCWQFRDILEASGPERLAIPVAADLTSLSGRPTFRQRRRRSPSTIVTSLSPQLSSYSVQQSCWHLPSLSLICGCSHCLHHDPGIPARFGPWSATCSSQKMAWPASWRAHRRRAGQAKAEELVSALCGRRNRQVQRRLLQEQREERRACVPGPRSLFVARSSRDDNEKNVESAVCRLHM